MSCQSMRGSHGDLTIFASNWLVGSITLLALVLLFWPVLAAAVGRLKRAAKPSCVQTP